MKKKKTLSPGDKGYIDSINKINRERATPSDRIWGIISIIAVIILTVAIFNKKDPSLVILFFFIYSNSQLIFEFSNIFFPFLPIKKIKFLYLEKFSYTKFKTTGIGLNARDIIVPVFKSLVSKIFFW